MQACRVSVVLAHIYATRLVALVVAWPTCHRRFPQHRYRVVDVVSAFPHEFVEYGKSVLLLRMQVVEIEAAEVVREKMFRVFLS